MNAQRIHGHFSVQFPVVYHGNLRGLIAGYTIMGNERFTSKLVIWHRLLVYNVIVVAMILSLFLLTWRLTDDVNFLTSKF